MSVKIPDSRRWNLRNDFFPFYSMTVDNFFDILTNMFRGAGSGAGATMSRAGGKLIWVHFPAFEEQKMQKNTFVTNKIVPWM